MQPKGKYSFRQSAISGVLLLFHLGLWPLIVHCQPSKEDVPTQRLLLQLASCFLNVVRQNQIDIDSGLVIASQRMHLNPMIVIDETTNDGSADPATNASDLYALKTSLTRLTGDAYFRALNRIGAIYAFRPGARIVDLDSALVFLEKARREGTGNPVLLSRTQSLIGKSWLEKGDTARAAAAFREAIDLAVKARDKHAEATAWAWWGVYAAFQPETILSRIVRLKKADSIFKITDDRRSRINTLSNIGYLQVAAGKIADSRNSFDAVLALEDSIHFAYTHYTLDTRCLLAVFEEDMVKLQQYAMEETRAAETTHDSTALAYIYARRLNAESYDEHDRGAGALTWGYKSLAEFRRWHEDLLSYRVAHNVGMILINMGRNKDAVNLMDSLLKRRSPEDPGDKHEAYLMLGMAYIDLNSLDKAQHYLLLAQQLQPQVSQFSGNLKVSILYFLLGKLYFAKQEFEKSRSYFSIALLHPNNFFDANDWASVYKYLASIDSAAGRFREAYLHGIHYNMIMDSIRRKVNLRLLDEMRTKYETDKKDNNIKILQQQAALQAARNQENLFARNALIGGATALLIVLLLLYNRFRLKQRTNLQLQAQKSEITNKNAVLQHLVEEKEWLLKEVHHRVKNNLYSIICLLESQARHLKDDALKAIEVSQHRIYAMSLIHQKLYQSSDLKAVDMAVYLPEFVGYLRNSFDNTRQIIFALDVQPVRLDVAQAVPLALIVNEAVTNSIKYAFPGGQKGTIRISMRHTDGMITLRIADDGIGIAPDLVDSPVKSLGLKLIRGLSGDINANIQIKNDNGTVVELQFQPGLSKSPPTPTTSFKEEVLYT